MNFKHISQYIYTVIRTGWKKHKGTEAQRHKGLKKFEENFPAKTAQNIFYKRLTRINQKWKIQDEKWENVCCFHIFPACSRQAFLFFFFYFLSLIFSCSATVYALEEPLKKEYIFSMPMTTTWGGQSASQVVVLLQKACDIISKKLSINLKLERVSYVESNWTNEIIKKFKAGSTDFAWIDIMPWLKLKNEEQKMIVPFLSIAINKRDYLQDCLYVRKSDNIKSLTDLKGKKWGGRLTSPTRRILLENGITLPLHSFFKMLFIRNERGDNLSYNLIKRNIDVFHCYDAEMSFVIPSDKRFSELSPFICTKSTPFWPFVHRSDINRNLVQEIKKIFLNIHKDKDFQEVRFFLTAMKGRFIPFEDITLEHTKYIIKLENDKNLLKEQEKFWQENNYILK